MATLTSLFKSATTSNGGANNTSDCGPARLIFRDNEDADPELLVVVSQATGGKTIRQVALGKIDRVVLEEGGTGNVVLLGRPPLDRHGKPEGPAKEELRLLFIQEGGSSNGSMEEPMSPSQAAAASYPPVSNDTRNTLIHHLQVLMEWERQRRSDLALDSLDDEPNFLRKKAQTAARFAEREIELRETTRARAERKAKLVAQAGGLKYTALAMANQHELT